MLLTDRIIWSRYIPLNLISTLGVSLLARNVTEVMVFFGVAIVTVVNHLMLCRSVELLLYSNEKENKSKILFYTVGKVLVLVFGLTLGVHFIGSRIILALANYVGQIFALGISLKRV
jgi:hypothetical protein